jgi:antitoxin ParD1/3/4
MSAIRVLLNTDVSDLIEARVASGEYANASDYLSELILRDQTEGGNRSHLSAEIEAAIMIGLADAEAGRLHDADEVFDALEAKYTGMIEAAEG